MRFFNFLKKKSKQIPEDSNSFEIDTRPDYLSMAAKAGHKAKAAVKAKEFDKAWGLYHEQKSLYLAHANRSSFTTLETLSLDASVHEHLANILRLESKHDAALVNVLYWIIAQSHKPIKRHNEKLTAYFNRCKFSNTSLEEALDYITLQRNSLDFSEIQLKVAEWRKRDEQ